MRRLVAKELISGDSASVDASSLDMEGWELALPAFVLSALVRRIEPDRGHEISCCPNLWAQITRIELASHTLRKGQRFYLVLVDGQKAGIGRRKAQINTSAQSFAAPGIEKESFAGRKARALDAERVKTLAAFVEKARSDAEVPGLAVAVVQNGRIILERGFGTTEIGKRGTAITPQTLFMIGSATKSLTTLLMARLVESKKLAWDSPVTELLPTFALGDPRLTETMTLRHTVCACTGMPRRDLDFVFDHAGRSAEDRLAELKTMTPTTKLGETFQYSNHLVAAGGYAAAHVAYPNANLETAYEKALRADVTGPLGMTSTTTRFDEARRKPHALPHGEGRKQRITVLPLKMEEMVSAIAPAGAVWSSLRDLEKELFVELGLGKLEGGPRFLSEASMKERRTAQVKITDDASYGLGLYLEKEGGVDVVGHGGNTLGFTSDVFFLPEHDVGVVVLANSGGNANAVLGSVRRRVLELLFDGKEEARAALSSALARNKAAAAKESAKVRVSTDPSWATAWLGSYTSPELGSLKVLEKGRDVVVDVGEWQSAAAEKVDETSATKWVLLDAPWGGGFELVPKNVDGKATLSIETPQHRYVFERR